MSEHSSTAEPGVSTSEMRVRLPLVAPPPTTLPPSAVLYLAAPYWHERKEVRDFRANTARACARRLIEHNCMVYCPFIYSYGLETAPRGGEEYWRAHSLLMAQRCDEIMIIELDGWKDSAGVMKEIEIFKERGKRLYFYAPVFDTPPPSI